MISSAQIDELLLRDGHDHKVAVTIGELLTVGFLAYHDGGVSWCIHTRGLPIAGGDAGAVFAAIDDAKIALWKLASGITSAVGACPHTFWRTPHDSAARICCTCDSVLP